MRFNRRTLILLGCSVLIIMGVLIFQDPLQKIVTLPTPTPTVQRLLPDRIAEQTIQFVVRQQANFTQIDKVNGVWQVTDGSSLDETRETHSDFVDGLLQLMSGFEYISAFESDDVSQFGLENSTVSIEIQTETDLYILHLGQINPDGNRVYVMLNDAPTVYLMPTVFEFTKIVTLATAPPYRQLVAEVTPDLSDTLLFPDVFGYQIAEFMIRDERDGSFIRYTQGELGTWAVDGMVVNEERDIDHVQVAVNVSQFLFLDIEQLSQDVTNSATDLPILTLSMTTDDSQTYTMSVIVVDDVGYVGILDDGTEQKVYHLPTDTINLFFDMMRHPPYTNK
jgi:hypothetical protein